MKYLNILGLLWICLNFYTTKAQTVNLNGTVVNVNDIPLDNSLPINNSLLKSAGKPLYTPVLIFKSKNSSFFAKATNEIIEQTDELKSLSLSESPATGNFELFDANGTLLYKTKTEWPILRCKISSDGKICGITTSWSNEEDWYSRMIFLNNNGSEIFREDSIDNYYPNTDGRIVYYFKTQGGSRYLFCKNFNNGSFWKIPIAEDSWIGSVSAQGYHVVVNSSISGLYSYGSYGMLLWNNPKLLGGSGHLSYKGDFLLKMNNTPYYGFDLFENVTGKYLLTLGSTVFDGIISHAFRACFIDGLSDKIAVLYNVDGRYGLKIFNTQGEELFSQLINSTELSVNFFYCAYGQEGKVEVFINNLLSTTLTLTF